MHAATPKPKRTRRLFVSGKLDGSGPKPCSNGWHAGPLIDTSRFEAAGGIWHGTGCCGTCLSHVHRSQIRVPA